MSKRTILVVDDEQPIQRVMRRILERAGYEVLTADNTAVADRILAEVPVDAVLCDQVLPGEQGLVFLERLQRSHPKLVRVLVTGFGDLQIAKNAINKAKVQHFLSKPFEPEEVLSCLRGLLRPAPAVSEAREPANGGGRRELRTVDRMLKLLREVHPGIDQVTRNTQGRILLGEGAAYRVAAPSKDAEASEDVERGSKAARLRGQVAPKRPEPERRYRRQPTVLRELEVEHPGISAVDRTRTGSIVIDDETYRRFLDSGEFKRPVGLSATASGARKQADPWDGSRSLAELLDEGEEAAIEEGRRRPPSDRGPFDTEIVFDEALLKLIG